MLKRRLQNFDQKTLIRYLQAEDELQQELFQLARQAKEKVFGKQIWLRGIIEFSNICQNNCFYCGIRKGNQKQKR
ncbi:MAG: hypothetical protein Q8O41_07075, partial [Candidatus Methanoperedens sp.]|nr:hypothetical protein [Candidatus Methanoperedens sp.]